MAYNRVNVSDTAWARGLQRPRRHLSPERRVDYPEVFWAVQALGETDEDAEEAELRIKQIIAASEPMPLDDVFRKGGAL